MPEPSPIGRRSKVTLAALRQRLNRRLKADHRTIRSPRGVADRSSLGDYFEVDTVSNVVVDCKLTVRKLEAMARKLKVLEPWEEVEVER
jgi:hypothetical protein